MRTLIAFAAFALFAGCGLGATRDSVVMKINDTDAHIRTSKNEVAVGDPVNLKRRECVTRGLRTPITQCKDEVIGHGQVVQVLNDNYSVARFSSRVQFKEGDGIEKISK